MSTRNGLNGIHDPYKQYLNNYSYYLKSKEKVILSAKNSADFG